jgi:hypothetical protein
MMALRKDRVFDSGRDLDVLRDEETEETRLFALFSFGQVR